MLVQMQADVRDAACSALSASPDRQIAGQTRPRSTDGPRVRSISWCVGCRRASPLGCRPGRCRPRSCAAGAARAGCALAGRIRGSQRGRRHGPRAAHDTWSAASSTPRPRAGCGSPTSPSTAPARTSFTSAPSRTASRTGSSAIRSPSGCARRLSSPLSSPRSPAAVRSLAASFTPITSRFGLSRGFEGWPGQAGMVGWFLGLTISCYRRL